MFQTSRGGSIGEKLFDRHVYAEERKQSHTRLIYIVVLVPIIAFIGLYQGLDLRLLWLGIGLYVVASVAHLWFLSKNPKGATEARKLFAIFIDTAITTMLVSQLQESSFLFSILYLWIILGNGMRFGESKLFVAVSLAVVGIAILYFLSPYWHDRPLFVFYMLLEVLVIPLFMARLIRRLEEKERLLTTLLQKSEHFALHDALTGLENRYAFEAFLTKKIQEGESFTVLFVDLDGFKQVNDTMGHDIGDRALQEVARRIGRFAERSDNVFVARLGGDEFVVIVDGALQKAVPVAQELLDVLREPYDEGRIDSISASIGLAHYPSHAQCDFDLKKAADVAMYRAKREGKNRYAIYGPALRFQQKKDSFAAPHTQTAATF